MKGSYALITGASGGIGYEIAKELARRGFNTVLVSRNREKLIKVKAELEREFGVSAVVVVKDLSEENSAVELFEEVKKRGIDVEILVNNAGFGVYGKFSETNLEKEIAMIKLNVLSLTVLTKLFLKDMIEKGRGKILNVASIAGFQPVPLLAVYSATKSYVVSFTNAVAEEVRGSGVSITCLAPGPTDTSFFVRAGADESKLTQKMMSPDKVARIGVKAMMKGKRIAVPGFLNRVIVFLSRVGPVSVVVKVARKMVRKFRK